MNPSSGANSSPKRPHYQRQALIRAALGIYGKSASPVESELLAIQEQPSPLMRRFILQGVAREVYKDLGFGVSRCLRSIIPSSKQIEVHRSEKTGATKYANLQTCKSVWVCPVCAARISERRRADLQQAVTNWRQAGGKVIFATYTLAHDFDQPLREVLGALKASHRSLKSGKGWQTIKTDYGFVGSVVATEITYGLNGWHPHLHELLFLEKTVDPKELQADLRDRWLKSLGRHGGSALPSIGLQIEYVDHKIAEYIAKWGHEPSTKWSSAHEMAKSQQKQGRGQSTLTPLGLLEAYKQGVNTAPILHEYALATKGTRQLVWSAGLEEKLGLDLQTDEEIIADNDPHYEILAVFTKQEWSRVLKEPAVVRGKILDLARGGFQPLRDYLLRLGVWRAGVAHDPLPLLESALIGQKQVELTSDVYERWADEMGYWNPAKPLGWRDLLADTPWRGIPNRYNGGETDREESEPDVGGHLVAAVDRPPFRRWEGTNWFISEGILPKTEDQHGQAFLFSPWQ